MQKNRSKTLAATWWPTTLQLSLTEALRVSVLVLAGSGLIALSAKTQVPFFPVPMTLQTLAISVIAASYGMRLGVATVLAYLAEGALGLPVFAGALAGPAYMAGPTAGFLVGFVIMAAVIGYAADKGFDRAFGRVFLAMMLANCLVFIPGLAWLATFVGLSEKLIATGLEPFAYATLFKTVLGAAIMPSLWRLTASLRG